MNYFFIGPWLKTFTCLKHSGQFLGKKSKYFEVANVDFLIVDKRTVIIRVVMKCVRAHLLGMEFHNRILEFTEFHDRYFFKLVLMQYDQLIYSIKRFKALNHFHVYYSIRFLTNVYLGNTPLGNTPRSIRSRVL